jgi:hypothetical protein
MNAFPNSVAGREGRSLAARLITALAQVPVAAAGGECSDLDAAMQDAMNGSLADYDVCAGMIVGLSQALHSAAVLIADRYGLDVSGALAVLAETATTLPSPSLTLIDGGVADPPHDAA